VNADRRGRGRDVDAVFAALADPTRRSVMSELAHTDSATASELARHVPVSRQAVVKHLQVLGRAGLVVSTRDGREVRYSFRAEPLTDVAAWIAGEGAVWDARLERLQRMFDRD
jgi:DNA-binding transcriptional ArsR family regulator